VIILNVGGLFLLVVVVVAVVGLWRWLRKPVDAPHMAKPGRTRAASMTFPDDRIAKR